MAERGSALANCPFGKYIPVVISVIVVAFVIVNCSLESSENMKSAPV